MRVELALSLAGHDLSLIHILNLGYSHPVEMSDPEGLEAVVDGNKIIVKGLSLIHIYSPPPGVCLSR